VQLALHHGLLLAIGGGSVGERRAGLLLLLEPGVWISGVQVRVLLRGMCLARRRDGSRGEGAGKRGMRLAGERLVIHGVHSRKGQRSLGTRAGGGELTFNTVGRGLGAWGDGGSRATQTL
jgi:hypothetical protein